MAKWVDKTGPIIASTVYTDNVLVAKDPAITLPAITYTVAEMQAMGGYEQVVRQLTEAMEATIGLQGLNSKNKALLKPDAQKIEVRFVQTQLDQAGKSREVGCKAFLTATPKVVPEYGLESGTTTEVEIAFSVSRYQLIVDGKEIVLHDKLAGILKINGVDYASSVDSML